MRKKKSKLDLLKAGIVHLDELYIKKIQIKKYGVLWYIYPVPFASKLQTVNNNSF